MAYWQIRDNAQGRRTVSGLAFVWGGHLVPFAITCTYMMIAGRTISANVPKNHVHTSCVSSMKWEQLDVSDSPGFPRSGHSSHRALWTRVKRLLVHLSRREPPVLQDQKTGLAQPAFDRYLYFGLSLWTTP